MSGDDGSSLPFISKKQMDELTSELRNIARAIAASKIQPDAGTEKNARFLRVFGFSEREIADLLGVTQPAVNKALNKKPR